MEPRFATTNRDLDLDKRMSDGDSSSGEPNHEMIREVLYLRGSV